MKQMNLNDITTQLIFTTVPIWVEKEGSETATATGFFYQHKIGDNISIPFIVTNAHVVKDANRGFISLMKRIGESPSLQERITGEIPGPMMQQFMDENNDIAVIPIGPVLNQLHQSNFDVFFRSMDPSLIPAEEQIQQLAAVEEILFVGYPSGILDPKNYIPIVRKGITATPVWNDFDGDPVFLIDAGVYPGSSGSPVLIVNTGSYAQATGIVIGNRVLFLGLIARTLHRQELNTKIYLGLGQVVKSTGLKSFIEEVVSEIGPK
jgi:hypothetical protein